MDKINEQIRALATAHEQGIDTVASGIQDLYKIHTAAKKAAETPYDADAFIFGG